jgi:hypothetical protein
MQLALVKNKLKNSTQEVGDVLCTFSDSHVFSEKETELFDIVQIDESVYQDYKRRLVSFYRIKDNEKKKIRTFYKNNEINFSER